MVGIQWPPEHVAALHPVVLPHLLGAALAVVAGCAQRAEILNCREWIAAGGDADAMIDRGRWLDPALRQACLAERMFSQLQPAQPLPALGRVRPPRHGVTRSEPQHQSSAPVAPPPSPSAD